MKKIIKLLSVLLALIFALSLVACGGSDDTDTDKDNESVASKTDDASSVDLNSTITMPDFEVEGFGEEKTVFVNSSDEQSIMIEVYHKDNEILSFTLTNKVFFGDSSEEEMKEIKKTLDEHFAEASQKENISYSCILANNEVSVVIAIRDLDIQENKEYMEEFGLYDGYTAGDTYEDLEAYALKNGFTKQ